MKTGNETTKRKRVLTKWAEPRLAEKYYSTVMHIHRLISKCVCVLLCV